ncbi:T9SS type B sorting domain-containing protein, partial [Flavobacterium myungsuense]
STGVFTGLSPDSYVVTVVDSNTPPRKVTSSTINLVAPTDITLISSAMGCVSPSSPVTLTASNGGTTYAWTSVPVVAISSTTTTAIVSPAVNTTYTVTSSRTILNTNLITNGGFESSNSGFYSDFINTPLSASLTQFDYGITTNPNLWNPAFITSTDRSGTGKMFVAKGATFANKTIWSQTILVDNSKSYTFEFFAQNAVSTLPAKFKVLINGVQITLPVSVATNAGSPGWTRIFGTWNSGTATTAKIQIINTNISLPGNDFAIDDISFTTTSKNCLLSKTVTVDVTPALSITNPASVCTPTTVNITLPAVTSGSTGGGTLSYWSDATATIALATPTAIASSGTYYIKSVSSICSDIKPVVVTINPAQALSITNPAEVCSPATINITLAAVTAGSTGGGVLSYWTNATATTPLATPTAIATSGTYYIKSTSGICSDIKPVIIKITTTPVLSITNPAEVCSPATVNIALPAVTAVSTGGGTLTYWTNATATTALATPTAIATSGTYYIKSTLGICSDIKPVTVTVTATPVLNITNPAAVCSPATVDITLPSVTSGSTGGGVLTYWTNATATISLATPTAITTSGTYYIKSVSSICSDIKPVVVTINPAQVLNITNPGEVCSPATINITLPAVTAGSTGGGTLTYWTNATATTALATPTAIATSGTYYIKSTSGICSDIKPITLTVSTPPNAGILSGTQNVCLGFSPTFSSTSNGGSWISSDTAIATVNSTTGIVTGVSVGTATITYTVLGIDGCPNAFVSRDITFNNDTNAGLLTGNTKLCQGLTIPLLSSISGGTWSSSDNNIATVNVAGVVTGVSAGSVTITYTISPTQGQCIKSSFKDIEVNNSIIPTFNSVNPICSGEAINSLPPISINGIKGNWSPILDNLTTKTYTFTPDNDQQCAIKQELTITVKDFPEFQITGECNSNNYELSINLNSNFSYNWLNAMSESISTTNSTIVTKNGNYSLEVVSDGCKKMKEYEVKNVSCNYPKGISPNNDEYNNFFDLENFEVKRLQIYNRYGQEVYSKNNYKNEWSGSSNDGKELPDGTYFYVITLLNNDKPDTGWVYINR